MIDGDTIGQIGIAAIVVFTYLRNRKKVQEVHVLVNNQMTTALARIVQLEKKLGLGAGEAIPAAQVVTQPGVEPDPELPGETATGDAPPLLRE